MVQGNQRPAVPWERSAHVVPKQVVVGLEETRRFERDSAEGDGNARLDEINLRPQPAGAVRYLPTARRPVIAIAQRVAEESVRYEDALAAQAGGFEQALESQAGLVGGERDAGTGGAESTGRLADDHDGRWRVAVRRPKDVDVAHVVTGETALDLRDQALKVELGC